MAMALLARALSLQRANQRAKALRLQAAGDSFTEYGTETSPEQSAIHSSRVSQSIDALYVLSCLRDGLSLADTFASDEDFGERVACCRRSDIEKMTISSQSLSEHARSSDANWDLFSSSLSSSGSESVESSGKDAVRCCSICSSSTEKREDFCLVFNTHHLVSFPSPPAAIVSDCCGFLMGRKSNHNEDEACGLGRRDKLAENVQGKDKLTQSNGSKDDGLSINGRIKLKEGKKEADNEHLQKGAAIVALETKKFCGPNEEEEKEHEELQRLLRKGAMKAVEKKSCNPYLDFRESMLQMMISACSSRGQCKVDAVDDAFNSCVDKYIEDLLYCYLRLNSMELHELITQAFSDTCSNFFSMQIS